MTEFKDISNLIEDFDVRDIGLRLAGRYSLFDGRFYQPNVLINTDGDGQSVAYRIDFKKKELFFDHHERGPITCGKIEGYSEY